MAVMEVVLQQVYGTRPRINRFNYIASGTPATVSLSFALAFAMGSIETAGVYPATGLMKRIAEVQVVTTIFDLITVKDVYSNTDFFSTPFITTLAGVRSGEGMPPFNAIGFRTNRVRADISRGTKRFVGVSETDSGAQGVLVGTILASCTTLALKMAETLTYNDEGNTITFTPAVVSKEEYDPNAENPLNKSTRAYRYYPTEAEQMLHVAQGIAWDVYSTVRPQSSRK